LGETLARPDLKASGGATSNEILANLRQPEGGSVSYSGKAAAEVGAGNLARHIAYRAQGGADGHMVAIGRLPHRAAFGRSAARDVQAVEQRARSPSRRR
jgi:ABC-type cobalamin/Fe3+-siderophores transport system ATPase subunit